MHLNAPFKLNPLLAALLAISAAGSLQANPQAPQVVHGQASFASTGQTLTVTNTPGAIINWQQFNINRGELTRFVQQSASSQVLNRVVGVDPSTILGALQSNGRVFLVNPNGIVFGAGAQVDVAGLVASTLNLSNGDFLANRLRFTDTPGAGNIKNESTLRSAGGGSVLLLAPNISNSGLISAPDGSILLAAGRSVEVAPGAHHPEARLPHAQLLAHQGLARGDQTRQHPAPQPELHRRVRLGLLHAPHRRARGDRTEFPLRSARQSPLRTGAAARPAGTTAGVPEHRLAV